MQHTHRTSQLFQAPYSWFTYGKARQYRGHIYCGIFLFHGEKQGRSFYSDKSSTNWCPLLAAWPVQTLILHHIVAVSPRIWTAVYQQRQPSTFWNSVKCQQNPGLYLMAVLGLLYLLENTLHLASCFEASLILNLWGIFSYNTVDENLRAKSKEMLCFSVAASSTWGNVHLLIPGAVAALSLPCSLKVQLNLLLGCADS